nr:hypothetical protein [Tanacetum cinerariifolium]
MSSLQVLIKKHNNKSRTHANPTHLSFVDDMGGEKEKAVDDNSKCPAFGHDRNSQTCYQTLLQCQYVHTISGTKNKDHRLEKEPSSSKRSGGIGKGRYCQTSKISDVDFQSGDGEVIEFRDSCEAPQDDAATGSASEGSTKKKGMTVAVTTEDMQKRRNDVKARTTLFLALPDEHQLRFSKTPMRINRPNMNAAQPKRTSFYKPAHSYVKRHVQRKSVVRTQFRVPRVSTGGYKITGKGTIKTGKLKFENVYFVKDLKYNLFSVSQICDNKNSVLFTDSECIVLGRDFKLRDDTNVLLRTPRQHNMYSINLNNIVLHKDLTCLVAKASADESELWHRRLGKQHKASCKTKLVNSVSKPLHTLHMNLFGPTSISSLNHIWYCLVVTDDFSRFTWTFFLKTKDETSGILRNFITEIENLKELKVEIIRCDNGGKFRNKEMNDFCSRKGIKREFSNARTPQQNRVAEKRNKTLIEAARTIWADAKLPITFWAEAVNTACYVQNTVLVNKSQNKTPYKLFNGRTHAIGFLKPFGCML